MKNLLIFLFLIFSNQLFSYDWNIIFDDSENPNTTYYYSIDSFDRDYYVISGYIYDKSKIINNTFIDITSDRGKNWIRKYSLTTDPLKGESPNIIGHIKLLSDKSIIAALRGGTIIRSTNFGDSWTSVKIDYHKDGPTRCMNFCDNMHGCLLYFYDNTLWITDDAGESWQRVDMPIFTDIQPYGFANVTRVSDSVFVGIIMNFSTYENWKVISNDKCNTWELLDGFDEYIVSIYFANEKVGYAGGQNYYGADKKRPIIYKTTNGGYDWIKIFNNHDIIADSYNISVFDQSNIIVVSFNHIIRTTNGGEKWSIETHEPGNPSSFAMRMASLGSINEGILICRKEYMLSNFLSSTTNVADKNINTNHSFLHPNPATSQITLSLGEEFISAPQIDIIDYIGNAIKPEFEINGSEITINTSSLSPGVYYLRIRSGGQVETKKFVVVR